jgi:poly(A) polymerase
MPGQSNDDLRSPPAEPDEAAVAPDAGRLVRTLVSDPKAVIGAADMAATDGARIREEIEQILLMADPRTALQRLLDGGVFRVWLPELDATRDLRQEGDRLHKDVWEHTKQVVAQSPARPAVRWAALLHDIGKVATRRFEPEGRVAFHGHAEVGATQFGRQIASRLSFPAALAAAVERLIRHHQRTAQYDEAWQDRAVRRLYRTLGAELSDLLDLSRADVTSRRAGRRAEALRVIDALDRRIQALQAEDQRVPPLPAGLGHHVMAHFGLDPGPRVGALIRQLRQAIEAGAIEAHRDPAYYLEFLDREGV